MALPVTISAATAPADTWRQIPLLVSGNVYVFARDATTATILKAFKATDPTSSFTEQSTGNRPTSAQARTAIAAVLSGTTIHVASVGHAGGLGDSVQFRYVDYNTSTDAWGTETNIFTSGNGPSVSACSIGLRSDGDILIAALGAYDAVMGTQYDRVDLFLRQVTTWTSNIDCTGDTGSG